MFTFEGIGIVLPLENKMKTPKGMPGWTGVLNTGMILVACLYIAVGFFGYLKYGDEVIDYCLLNFRHYSTVTISCMLLDFHFTLL